MKKAWNMISNVFVFLIAALAVCMVIFTVFSVNTFDRNDRSIFGYRLLVVLSDSMSATDFKAGDLIFVKETEPQTLESGDIIAYSSQSTENFGQTVAHKIRRTATDEEGNPGFITYGTTTGVDDDEVVTWPHILGKYRMRLPGVGRFFAFLKTVPGYMIFILLPFLLLLLFQGVHCVKLFREYQEEEMKDIRNERERLKQEREATRRLKEELDHLKAKLKTEAKELTENGEKGEWLESEEDE